MLAAFGRLEVTYRLCHVAASGPHRGLFLRLFYFHLEHWIHTWSRRFRVFSAFIFHFTGSPFCTQELSRGNHRLEKPDFLLAQSLLLVMVKRSNALRLFVQDERDGRVARKAWKSRKWKDKRAQFNERSEEFLSIILTCPQSSEKFYARFDCA